MICLHLLTFLPLNSNRYFVATQGQENIYTDIQNDQGSIIYYEITNLSTNVSKVMYSQSNNHFQHYLI